MMKKLILLIFIFFIFKGLIAQKDSIIAAKIEIFKVDIKNLKISEMPVDTSLSGFQNYYPFYDKDYSNVFLGNLGLPYYSTIYRPSIYNGFIFLQHIQDYWINSSDVQYLNTTKPYTHFHLYTGPRRDKENVVRVMHSRNINPFWNFTLFGGFNGSEGAYNFQQTRGSSVYTSTNYQKKNFRFFSYAMFNKQTNYENGGINDSIEMFGNQIPLKMDNASNVYGEKQFSQNIIYTIPLNIKKTEIVNIEGKDTIQEIIIKKPLLILGQSLLYTPKYKIYRDNAVDEIVYGGAFDYDSIQSFDSIYHSDLIFKLYAKTGDELLPIIKLGVFSEFMYKSSEIYNFREYVTTNNIGINIENWYKFGFYSESGKFFNWKLSYETFTKGSRADDNALKADANLNLFSEKFPIVINVFGNYSYRTPSPWLYRYYGNRVSWDATLERENLVNTKASISIKKLDLVLSGENGRLTNPVYFDENAKAAQLNGDLKYMNVQVAHILKIWRFRLGTNLTYQKLSDTINFKYPEITYKGSFYYEGKTISKSMFNQIGFEAYYFSSYYAPYYNPATALFYLQKNDLIGGMPLVNFFVNAQLRRSRVFLKFTNLNYLITKELFYTIPDYPLADTYFRFGVSWRFYD